MNFCPQCGKAPQNNANFCPECGTRLTSGGPGRESGPVIDGLSPRAAAVCCYVAGFVSGIIFLNLDPYRRDPDLRFHAWQSILLCGSFMLLTFVEGALGFALIPLWGIFWLVRVAFFGVWILAMIRAWNGEKWYLPLIGKYAEQQARKS